MVLITTNFTRNTLYKKIHSPIKNIARGMWSRSGSGNNGKNLWKVLETMAYNTPKNARRGFHTKKESENEKTVQNPREPEKPKILTGYWISKVETEKEKYNPSKKEENQENYAAAYDLENQSSNSSSNKIGAQQIQPQEEPVDLVAHNLSHPQVIETHSENPEITPHMSLTHHPLSKENQDKLGLEMVGCEKLSADKNGKTQYGTSFNRERTIEEKSSLYYNPALTKHFFGDKPRDLLDPQKEGGLIENYKSMDRLRNASITAIKKKKGVDNTAISDNQENNNKNPLIKNENNQNNDDKHNT